MYGHTIHTHIYTYILIIHVHFLPPPPSPPKNTQVLRSIQFHKQRTHPLIRTHPRIHLNTHIKTLYTPPHINPHKYIYIYMCIYYQPPTGAPLHPVPQAALRGAHRGRVFPRARDHDAAAARLRGDAGGACVDGLADGWMHLCVHTFHLS